MRAALAKRQHAVSSVDDIRLGLAENESSITAGFSFTNPALRMFSQLSITVATSEPNRCPVTIGNDERSMFAHNKKLIIAGRHARASRVQRTFGRVHVRHDASAARTSSTRGRVCSEEAG